MFDQYLLTGATGFLGRAIMTRLLLSQQKVRVLVLPNDKSITDLPDSVSVYKGDIQERDSLIQFFSGDLSNSCLIHCAGIISISSKEDKRLHGVNVIGTMNVLDLAKTRNIKKVIYVSSVHAIMEQPSGVVIRETDMFSPTNVHGQYAKSKAEASDIAMKYAKDGMNISIVHPSGLIGPGDYEMGNITNAIALFCNKRIPCGIDGAYDFVDVRDVAAGVIACSEMGKSGEGYLLTNRYITLDEIFSTLKSITGVSYLKWDIPYSILKRIAPVAERICLWLRKPLFLTPYSVYTMQSNAFFSHTKADVDLNYHVRPLEETLRDTVQWLLEKKLIKPFKAKRED